MTQHTPSTRRARPGRPITVRNGPVVVRIYRINRGDGRTQWRVAWVPAGGGREMSTHQTESEARRAAAEKAQELAADAAGGTLTLGPEEHAALLAARRALDGTAWSLDHAMSDWRAARDLLPPGVTVAQAARDYAARHPWAGTCPPAKQIVDAFLDSKRAVGRSDRHLRDLEQRLGRFAAWCQTPLPDLRPSHIEDWLGSMGIGGRSRNNYLTALTSLVRFAERRGWVGKGAIDTAGIDRAREEGEVGIFTPEELKKLFAAARQEMVPFLALGAFAGLRHAEVVRMDWSEVGEDYVEVKAAKAKTRSRRLVPVLPALAAWLAPHRRASGRVCRFDSSWNQVAKLREDAKVAWKDNGLRHSFGTYRLAIVKNEAQVALEMGNTPTMIFRHYRALATEQAARDWFAVLPTA